VSTLLSLFLIGFIQTGSVGFVHDPLFDGISLKLGAVEGVRGNFMIGFGTGETQVDSSKYGYDTYINNTIYQHTFYRPYYWINYGLRAEYYLTPHHWYQTYIGLGVEGKKESRWYSEYGWQEDDSSYINYPKKAITDYWGPTLSAGINFMPIALFAKLAKLDISFANALSFNVEICSYYLIKHDFSDTYFDNDRWVDFGYYQERKFSGIGSGVGIHYNW